MRKEKKRRGIRPEPEVLYHRHPLILQLERDYVESVRLQEYWWRGQLQFMGNPRPFIERVISSLAPVAELKALWAECGVGYADPRGPDFIRGRDQILIEICRRTQCVFDIWWAHAQLHDDARLLTIVELACAFSSDSEHCARMLVAIEWTIRRKFEKNLRDGKDVTLSREVYEPALALLGVRIQSTNAVLEVVRL